MGHINRTNEKYLVGWGNEEEERKERRKEGEGKRLECCVIACGC